MKDLFRNGTIILDEIMEVNPLPIIEDYELMFKYVHRHAAALVEPSKAWT
jgi:hypothetical protein